MSKPTAETAIRDAGFESPRSVYAMEKAGIKTVGDLANFTLAQLAAIKGVGERTLEQVNEILGSDVKREEDFDEVEEGPNPIHLMSPFAQYQIWVRHGDIERIQGQRGGKVFSPVVIRFVDGRGKLTREQYLMRKYARNEDKIREHIEQNLPWRKEAVEWLKSRRNFGRSYHLMD
jgi:hypothetical protein